MEYGKGREKVLGNYGVGGEGQFLMEYGRERDRVLGECGEKKAVMMNQFFFFPK